MLLHEINFPFKIGTVGNYFMNHGTINHIKKQDILHTSTDIGITNLFSKAQQH